MTNITRRAALGGLALLSAPVAAGHAAQLGDRQAALDAYRESNTAEDRLMHHLFMAALALDDLCPTDQCRWQMLGAGEPRSFNPRFRVARFDECPEFPDPRMPGGVDHERCTILFSRPNPWRGM